MKFVLFRTLSFLILLLINLELTFLIVRVWKGCDCPWHTYSWMIAIYLLYYALFKLLNRRMVSLSETYLIFKANILALITIFSLLFLSGSIQNHSKNIVLIYFLLNLFIPIPLYLIKKLLINRWFQVDVLAICDQDGKKQIEKWFSKENGFGFRIKDIVLLGEKPLHRQNDLIKNIISNNRFYAVVIASNKLSKVFYLIDIIQPKISRIIVLPKISTMPLFHAEIINSIHHKGLAFFIQNRLLNPVDKTIKRFFDLSFASVLFLVSLPVMSGIYLAIWIQTKKNPIFTQTRIGKDGKPFTIYKFKTMVDNAEKVLEEYLQTHPEAKEEYERYRKLKNDPRITSIGKFLRKSSLDELPQLVNILKGDMSLIGPRPILPQEAELFGEFFSYYCSVRPGVTGLWQVSGRNELDFDERVKLDVWYVRNWSLEIDILILLKTVVIVLSRKGSY
ncbi:MULTISPECIES: exopolysaccharide biosynthesis polyprenyl glycosylphosphotransferase [unclassified Nitratiruptor]|uniref:exopolysaccharide biosynthesis polyprenyl glycosylphosphotransferase n=1 Tax=unclassified Nitratiruptor TaxID=2624044 RepID=UPI001915A6F5|nr:MULTISPECIES: exopolysaccharide biosynthesis polyprenyl glycosylphosphotransferase [unclassified Nitratiruptor]BCD60712.1 undecaprenyl-phosphate galactose phosphotransferase [Nitratiruptor sp. YY08-10]BCD64644.1 undecaprenyl-phosphate galactose phosphotransferase [Nitratiruptor sp. YY08-14]